MKILLILVSLLTFANLARAASEEVVNEDDIFSSLGTIESATPYIKEFIDRNYNNIVDQFQNTCPKIAAKVYDEAVSAIKCFSKTDPNQSICTVFRTRFIPCITPVANTIDRCLPEKLKGTPMLLANALQSVINHVCTLNGEQMLQILNPCIRRSKYLNILTTRNFEKLAGEISVQNICSMGHITEKLWSDYVNKSCPDQFTRDVFIGLFHAANLPCI